MSVFSLRQTRPLTFLTFWLNNSSAAATRSLYHAVNLVLHLGAVLLAL